MSNNFGFEQLSENQTLKEATINTAFGQVDAALSEQLSISLASGNATVSDTNYRRNAVLFLTAATVSGRTVTLPAIKRQIIVQADATNTQGVAVVRGSTSYTVAPGNVATFRTDGTTNGLKLLSGDATGAGVITPYDVGTFCAGKPEASEVLLRYVYVRSVNLAASLAGSQVKAGAAATAQADFDVKKNGASIGTIRFAASGTTATYVGISATSFVTGDILSITAPSVADDTLADISFTLAGDRV